MDNIGKRIKKLREGLGLTQEEFALRVYIARGYLSQIERGKNPSALVLLAIQNIFGVSKRWLLAGRGPKRDVEGLERALGQAAELADEQPKAFDQIILKSKGFDAIVKTRGHLLGAPAPVPALKVVSRRELKEAERWEAFVPIPLVAGAAAAGDPRAISDHDIEDYCLIHQSWCKRPEDYVCVRLKGDSMEPVLPDGSIVAVHLKSRSPQRLTGKLVAARHEGGVAVKELARAGDHWVLLSYNKEHGPIVLDPLGEESPIIGKVAWWWARQE